MATLTIDAIAHLNVLTTDVDNDYFLTAKSKGSLTEADIVARMAQREIATKNVNGEAFIKEFFNECKNALAEGYTLAFSLFQAGTSIKGSVLSNQLGHTVGSDQVKVSASFQQGTLLTDLYKDVSVNIFEQSGATGPVIQSIMNPVTQKEGVLNAGQMVLIQGKRIAIKGDEEFLGVIFTSVSDPETEVYVTEKYIYPNTLTKLQFTLPESVTAGQWRVSVRTQASASMGTVLKEPRVGEYEKEVTVV